MSTKQTPNEVEEVKDLEQVEEVQDLTEIEKVEDLAEAPEEVKEEAPVLKSGGLRGISTPTMIHTHLDNFLAKIVGETPVDTNVRNSLEYWLDQISKGTSVVNVEPMTGYSFTAKTTEITWTKKYAGVVKNGNKLTFVIAGTFTYGSGISNTPTLGTFTIPADIYNKINGIIGTFITSSTLPLVEEQGGIGVVDKEIVYDYRKSGGNTISVDIQKVNSSSLVNDTVYGFRCDLTVLLSDSM